MLKTLIKKQLAEVGSFLYYDAKKGTRRSGAGKVRYGIFLGILFLLLGVMFGGIAWWIGGSLFVVDLAWMYWALVGLMSIVLGVFGSVFNTFTTVYLPKDNEMLLALPIKKSHLLISRLAGVYIMGLFYEALVFLPSMVVSWISGGFRVGAMIAQLIMLIVLSLIILVLSAVLGWVVAIISARLHNKSFVTVFISLVFIAAYYYVYGKAANGIGEILKHADSVAVGIKSKGYLVYQMGNACDGNWLDVLAQAGLAVAATLIVYAVLIRSFDKILMMKRGEKRASAKEKDRAMSSVSQKSVSSALFRKELQRFTKSSSYMLNCGLGTVFTFALGIFILIKGGDWYPHLVEADFSQEVIVGLATIAMCFVASVNDITAPSISMEGKSLWILQSLPVSAWEILKAKLKLHIYLTLPGVIFADLCVAYAFKFTVSDAIIMILLTILFVVFTAVDGLVIGLKSPNLNWTNETFVLKQSFGVFAAIFGNWILLILIGIGGLAAFYYVGLSQYLTGMLIAMAVLCRLMLMWLQKKGSRIFENL